MINEIMTDMATQTTMPTKDPYDVEDSAYPQSFEVTEKQLPEIKQWEVGTKYTFAVEAIMKEERVKDSGVTCARFVMSDVTSGGMAKTQPATEENNDFVLEEYFNE